ncbi:MAG: NifU family protein [Pseudobdellovibrionaceae bacterium]|nr:NifU family protein [Bdellovibrionales bacterium]USN48962.1 MAG: NifU family protein [Pseudobdellovibrionaceae bacterium]
MTDSVQVFYEATPNPQSMKFVIDRDISPETVQFSDPKEAQRAPLAAKIFGFPWTSGVFLGSNFVTVTKQDWVDWETLAEPLSHLIAEHLDRQEPVIFPKDSLEETTDDDPTVRKIKEILNNEIRPAVAMDGGDIVFDRYEEGVVFVYMQGACSGCPSSSLTLKSGIEARLKEAIPEIIEVVAL